jgi:hypothetical protein
MMGLRNVTLEMSLKPFRDDSEETARAVCRHLFTQWKPLIDGADMVSVMLWCADGSEILEYRGDLSQTFEWARYIGFANPRENLPNDPEGIALGSRWYLYIDNPPEFTYGWLKRLVTIIKEEGVAICGKPVRVGETFDPGPEFARSPFKYERHNEICLGNAIGRASFVGSYATLHADDVPYAGFPQGIPEGTPLGIFLGRQAQHFLGDMGFDYIWFSNGFGFGTEPWGLRGAIFDGEQFRLERLEEVRAKSVEFWKLFRQECPEVPIETRGTNLSTGMDLSSDAVPLREIYEGGYGLEPPPNSPWAALNGDYGLELVGWMSHIAQLPGNSFPFRFYTHDPWWLNSPWLDRYGREPHDIYLPLSVGRLDGAGQVQGPSSVLLVTADDSYGQMPDQVPIEVIPHLQSALREAPDAAGPVVWVYPFDEYHDWTFGEPKRIGEVFFGDWFTRGAVNRGLPLNTVISTRNLQQVVQGGSGALAESVLVSPVPQAGSGWEAALLSHVMTGGRALLYGPLSAAGHELRDLLGVACAEPLAGQFEVSLNGVSEDLLSGVPYATSLQHAELFGAGGITEQATGGAEVLATLTQGGQGRVGASLRDLPGGGALGWVRGTVSCDPKQTRGHLLVPLNAGQAFPAEVLMRLVLGRLGVGLRMQKVDADQRDALVCIARHANAFYFSGYSADTTVSLHLRFAQGAPLLVGAETRLARGASTYTMPRAWHRECRVFVDQAEDSLISCREQHSAHIGIKRRLSITGLKDATLRFYPEPGREESLQMLVTPRFPYLVGDFREPVKSDARFGNCVEIGKVTGELLISW